MVLDSISLVTGLENQLLTCTGSTTSLHCTPAMVGVVAMIMSCYDTLNLQLLSMRRWLLTTGIFKW